MDAERYPGDRNDPQVIRNYSHVLGAMPTLMGIMLIDPTENIRNIISMSYELGITEGFKQARQMLARELKT